MRPQLKATWASSAQSCECGSSRAETLSCVHHPVWILRSCACHARFDAAVMFHGREAGCDVNARLEGRTALSWAVRGSDKTEALSRGAGVSSRPLLPPITERGWGVQRGSWRAEGLRGRQGTSEEVCKLSKSVATAVALLHAPT